MKETEGSSAAVARLCARILDSRKLEVIEVLEVGPSLHVAEFFVIATGHNSRQLKAASNELFSKLREEGVQRLGVEGYDDAQWILVDLADVVVHLMLEEKRAYYDLDNLWGDCPRLRWEGDTSGRLVRSGGTGTKEGG